MQNLSPIIEVDELMQISENQNLRIFDVRTGSNAKENYIKKKAHTETKKYQKDFPLRFPNW